jgi:NitT/TauT family transport system substrate-binding protein
MKINNCNQKFFVFIKLIFLAFLLSGCGSKELKTEDGLIKVTLQTDWYAQAEHGGFYQALAEGYYEQEGLKVEILQGGPNALSVQRVASGATEFSIGRSDDIIIQVARGIPLVMIGALMQHDPQGILVHEEGGVKEFADLDGKAIMATPGSVFIDVLRSIYGITIDIIPLDYGMNRFIADKEFIQQCFVTNEPYYVRQAGANPRTLLISDSGFAPYRVMFANRNFADRHPEVVAAFTRASIRGWESYMDGPREKANALIRSFNVKMTEEFMLYSIDVMESKGLVRGRNPEEAVGRLSFQRIAEQIETLQEIGLLDRAVTPAEVVRLPHLP